MREVMTFSIEESNIAAYIICKLSLYQFWDRLSFCLSDIKDGHRLKHRYCDLLKLFGDISFFIIFIYLESFFNRSGSEDPYPLLSLFYVPVKIVLP